MKIFKHIFAMLICAMPFVASAQVATTAGNNLTAWNGNSGATNNNNWNQMMNSRTMAAGGSGATADFGNCNSLILRCAQPKCSGCSTIDIARPIVQGCVNSNDSCKKYGDDLIEYISAQLVSNANTKAQQQQLAAQQAASVAAQQQSAMQMQQMQQQMAQMQQQMQQQNEQQIAQMQAALDEQKQLTAAAMQEAAAQQQQKQQISTPSGNAMLTDAQVAAAQDGVSADVLAREQIAGQIMSKIESAEVALKKLDATMQDAFVYAGCDARGNNCSGPKRVKIFKEKAMAFFEPYDEIVDEAYEGLEMALAVGVDVSDVIMMLSGACNQWGKFLCVGEGTKHEPTEYNTKNCQNGRSIKGGYIKGGMECTSGMAVPPQDDARCTLTSLIGTNGDNEDVYREWLDENYEGDRLVRVGCATSALDSISIFGRKNSKRGATLDLDTLERIISQDAPDYAGGNRLSGGSSNNTIDRVKYCKLTESGYKNLLAAVQSKKLPKRICVPYDSLRYVAEREAGVVSADSWASDSEVYLTKADAERANGIQAGVCVETYDNKKDGYWKCTTQPSSGYKFYRNRLVTNYEYECKKSGGDLVLETKCECNVGKHADDNGKCVEDEVPVTDDHKKEARKCTDEGGWYDVLEEECMCGDVPMDYKKQKCKDKKDIIKK